jgi:predicted AlkP superfamily phosphohydrolase/phosphomutase
VFKVYDTAKEYRGLYVDDAPDLIIGYAPGYRVSWESAVGAIEPELFCDNVKAWSGDHHIDPAHIPGVFFANRKVQVDNPAIIDMAPTVLELFGVAAPAHMEGRAVL